MSAAEAVRAALTARLAATPALAAIQIGGADMAKGALPRIEVALPVAGDWSTKDWRGRELRTAVIVRAAAGQAGRLAGLVEGAERAIETIAGDLGGGDLGGWRLASVGFLRTRALDEAAGVRAVLVEHRVRVVAN